MAIYTSEVVRKKFEDAVASFCLLDDPFMTVVFQDSLACVDLVIQIILGNPNLHATKVVTQDTLKNLHGHSVRLDIHAIADGQEFNIEIQRAAVGAARRRARYNSSIIDAAALSAGEDYERLPETYVIFITETDVLGRELPIYHVQRTIRETQETFDDGSHIIYVNSSVMDDTPLGRLMHDFRCKRVEEMHYDVLKERAERFKDEAKGVMNMSSNPLWDEFVRAYDEEMRDKVSEKVRKEVSEKVRKEVSEKVRKEVSAEVRKEVSAEVRKEVSEKERVFSIKKIMEKFRVSAESAMDTLAIPESEWARYKAML